MSSILKKSPLYKYDFLQPKNDLWHPTIDNCEYGCVVYDFIGNPKPCECVDGAELINDKCELSSRTTTVEPITTAIFGIQKPVCIPEDS